ncbi:MAG: hypothetical protein IJE89_06080 [Bacilli bacterium]|nr:hypothetical protein [Bacilli bacterium]
MEFIIDFYKELDTLNLIIFWGIIIVIILLLIFSMILINKNNKLKKMVEKQNDNEEELPIIKQEEITIENNVQEKENIIEEVTINEEEKNMQDDIVEYRRNLFEQSNNNKNIEIQETKEIEIPKTPYQKNVLREMSLSQTSPIGINRDVSSNNKKMEIAKDLDESLNKEEIEEKINISEKQINDEIKKKLNNMEMVSLRKTEINLNQNNQDITEDYYLSIKEPELNNLVSVDDETLKNEKITDNYKTQSKSEQYLEEVSRKLAEAEIPDEIERTNYELKQEEDAIISYKELMAKKDTIETIDEEDAIISIEELMNRNNKKEEREEVSKLYNLTEEEENDKFIKELKQFRNDL